MTTNQPTHDQPSEAVATPSTPGEILYRKQLEILDLFGTLDFDPEYDYKANRLLDKIPDDEFADWAGGPS